MGTSRGVSRQQTHINYLLFTQNGQKRYKYIHRYGIGSRIHSDVCPMSVSIVATCLFTVYHQAITATQGPVFSHITCSDSQ